MKSKIKYLLFTIFAIAFYQTSAFAATYYVDSQANAKDADGSKEHPFVKIQTAADIVEPGDTVLVNPGVYYESISLTKSGTKEKPIVFRALKNGENETIITCANKDIREKRVKWTREDDEIPLYSVPYERNVSGILYNGAKMLGYTSLEELKTFECWSGARENSETTEGYPHGFWWDSESKKLYVHIAEGDKYGSSDPNANLMCVGGPYYEKITRNGVVEDGYRRSAISTDSYNFGILTENSANVILSGFTFETPGWCGVFVRAHDVTVSNCWFRGCMVGVLGGRYSMVDSFYSENVTVENCDWHLWPTFEDAIDKVKQPSQKFPYTYYWWATKGTTRSLLDYEAGSFCTRAGKNWTIRNNMISSCLDAFSWALTDGLEVEENGFYYSICVADGIKMYGNRFERCLDNAIEFENHAKNVDVYNNEFVDIFLPISWQPLDGPPWPTNLKVHHNVFKTSPELVQLFLEKANYPLEWLKVGASSSQWNARNTLKYEEWDAKTNRPVKPIWMQDKGMWIYNNSVYIPDGYTSEVVGTLVGSGMEYNNSYIVNNIIYCRAQTEDKPFRTYIQVGEFVSRDENGQGWVHKNNLFIPSNPGAVELVKTSPMGTAYETMDDAGITMDGDVIYINKSNSPAIGGGMQVEIEERDTTDIGPVPYGETWESLYGIYKFGDVNRDGSVDITDISVLSEISGNGIGNIPSDYDLNFDGKIDDNDVLILVNEIDNSENVEQKDKILFDDIDNVMWAKECILSLAEKGILSGDGNGKFRPNDFLSREEFVKMVVAAFMNGKTGNGISFEDVKENDWYAPYIDIAFSNGVISGQSSNLFGVGNKLTREDMVVILYRLIEKNGDLSSVKFDDNDAISDYAKEAVEYMSAVGVISGTDNNYFEPKSYATRAMAAKVLYNTLSICK